LTPLGGKSYAPPFSWGLCPQTPIVGKNCYAVSKSFTFASRRIFPKDRDIYSVPPLVMVFAYVPGERARKNHATPPPKKQSVGTVTFTRFHRPAHKTGKIFCL
jgi:hypothetical protein